MRDGARVRLDMVGSFGELNALLLRDARDELLDEGGDFLRVRLDVATVAPGCAAPMSMNAQIQPSFSNALARKPSVVQGGYERFAFARRAASASACSPFAAVRPRGSRP